MSRDAATVSTGFALRIVIAVLAVLFVLVVSAAQAPAQVTHEATRSETLWIFEADFEDLLGDNAGWVAEDRSGTAAVVNYWHRDTLRPGPCPEGNPGIYSWWCGTENPCWQQPRGYGNGWFCCLERDFPLSAWSIPGDQVTLEFCQRYAMERWYDYGYVDISTDGGSNWTTRATYTNGGFLGAGLPMDWDGPLGRQVLDMSAYAGVDVRLRYRFESDEAYSSQDQPDNPPQHSVKDGAWQIDDVVWSVNRAVVWSDECEGPGDNGWEHEGISATGQTGVTFFRGQLGVDFATGRPPYPGQPPDGTWMYAATDPFSSTMVDGQNSWLVTPPINVAGAPGLVFAWEGWLDFPHEANDIGVIDVATGDLPECVPIGDWWVEPDHLVAHGPEWTTEVLDWDVHAGNDWLKVAWVLYGGTPDPGEDHMAGLFLNRVRVGVPLDTDVPEDEVLASGITRVYPNPFNPSTTIEYSLTRCTHTVIRVVDPSGRVVATLLDAPEGPGAARVTWDGTTESGDRAASGVYFVVLDANGETSTRKMVLLK